MTTQEKTPVTFDDSGALGVGFKNPPFEPDTLNGGRNREPRQVLHYNISAKAPRKRQKNKVSGPSRGCLSRNLDTNGYLSSGIDPADHKQSLNWCEYGYSGHLRQYVLADRPRSAHCLTEILRKPTAYIDPYQGTGH